MDDWVIQKKEEMHALIYLKRGSEGTALSWQRGGEKERETRDICMRTTRIERELGMKLLATQLVRLWPNLLEKKNTSARFTL